MEDLLDRLEDQNSLVETKMNKFQNLKDAYEKENAFGELQSLMQRYKSTVSLIIFYQL